MSTAKQVGSTNTHAVVTRTMLHVVRTSSTRGANEPARPRNLRNFSITVTFVARSTVYNLAGPVNFSSNLWMNLSYMVMLFLCSTSWYIEQVVETSVFTAMRGRSNSITRMPSLRTRITASSNVHSPLLAENTRPTTRSILT